MRHVLAVAFLWAVLTVVGIVLLVAYISFPVAASDEARVVDDAFTLLAILAVPVFTFVLSTLIYSVVRFRSRGQPTDDGPPIRTHRPVVYLWLLITTALTVAVIIHPGITGLTELRAQDREDVDLVVQVEGGRWFWKVTYPDQKVFSRSELVLPVGAHTRFNVKAIDVLHSFWIPAFRVKIDAVPGMVTTTYATPNEIGDFETDANFRLQCAELCGLGHALMRLSVRVVPQAEFEAWIAEQTPIR